MDPIRFSFGLSISIAAVLLGQSITVASPQSTPPTALSPDTSEGSIGDQLTFDQTKLAERYLSLEEKLFSL